MKIKQVPEDFIVEEVNKFDILDSGKFRLYLLEKKELETYYIFNYLARKNNIPLREFGFAGLKDKHAVTKQYFTVPCKCEIKTLKEYNFKITFLGFVEKEILRGDLIANKFKIVIRGLSRNQANYMLRNASEIKKHGVPNYFDTQRFRSVFSNEFAEKYVIKKDFESAVKIFLTKYSKNENKTLKDEKRMLLENWGNFSNLDIKSRQLSEVAYEYIKTKSWEKAYSKISVTQKKMYAYAYQSYLWNECVKELLTQCVPNLYPVEYELGTLLFYRKLNYSKPMLFKFATIGNRLKPSPAEKIIIEKILAKEGFSLDEMINSNIRDWNIKRRVIILKPIEFSISSPEKDEFSRYDKNPKFKINLSCSLPAGSYATMIIKRLFY